MTPNQIIRHYAMTSGILCLCLCLASLAFPMRWRWICGLCLGYAVRIFAFYWHSVDLRNIVSANPSRAKKLARGSYFKRLLLYGMAITIGITQHEFEMFSVLIGLLLLTLAIHAENLYGIYRSSRHQKKA